MDLSAGQAMAFSHPPHLVRGADAITGAQRIEKNEKDRHVILKFKVHSLSLAFQSRPTCRDQERNTAVVRRKELSKVGRALASFDGHHAHHSPTVCIPGSWPIAHNTTHFTRKVIETEFAIFAAEDQTV
jgi:hypothetical protein